MKIEIPYKFGQSVYLKNDPEQSEFLLNRIILCQKGVIILEVFGNDGEFFEVPEIMATSEPDQTKILGLDKKEED